MRDELLKVVTAYTRTRIGESLFVTPIEGVAIVRSDHPRGANHLLMKPALCVVVQGAKHTTFGDRRFVYGAGQALVVSVEMPAVGCVVEASPRAPYLGIVIELDVAAMREVVESLETPPKAILEPTRGVFVTDFEGPLADCVLRMMRLLSTPQAIPVLRPVIMKEIGYWLLSGPHGDAVARMTLAHGHAQPVLRAIHALRDRFTEPVRIEELASIAKMSPSAFHRQFKTITSMTPLHYQQQLRLLEARRLMIESAINVETAAYRVGYESPSQFSREYSRMFGKAPRRDVASSRAPATGSSSRRVAS